MMRDGDGIEDNLDELADLLLAVDLHGKPQAYTLDHLAQIWKVSQKEARAQIAEMIGHQLYREGNLYFVKED